MKKFIVLIVIIFFAGCFSMENRKSDPALLMTDDGMWSLVWYDEFEEGGLDSSRWNRETGNGFYSDGQWVAGWGNNELQYYTDSKENSFVKNGLLTIHALEQSITGPAGDKEELFAYTSARLNTRGKMEITYGRIEIRALLPQGKGFWSALWMLPADEHFGSWAASGEIDIMEGWGSDTSKVAGTLHYGGKWPENKFTGHEYKFPEESNTGLFHEYAIEWEPGEIRWYVDGELYQTQNRWYTPRGTYPAPFNKKFYLIINLAVGGNFDGEPDDSTRFPGTMLVDYVRVFELTGRDYRVPEKPSDEIPMEPRPEDFPPVPEDGNEVLNSDFTLNSPEQPDISGVEGTSHWVFLHLSQFRGDGSFSLDRIEEENFAKITIVSPGIQPYSIQLIQYLPLVKGHKYRVRFSVKAEKERKIQFKINGDEDNSWAAYSRVEAPALTTELKTYEYTFTMTEKSDPEARMEFNLGMNKAAVWIGNVELREIEP